MSSKEVSFIDLIVQLFFNLFVILITFYNALEIPRRSEHEILDSLRRDGARLYLVSYGLADISNQFVNSPR